MITSPNVPLPPLQRALRLARGVVAVSPIYADNALAHHHQIIDAERAEGPLLDQWIESVFDGDYRWYYMVTSSGGGRSTGTLPPGETPARVHDVRGLRPVTQEFRALVESMTHEEQSSEVGRILAASLSATTAGYSARVLTEFRADIKSRRADDDRVPVGVASPEQLTSFSQAVAGLRARYSADAWLCGGVATITDLAIEAGRRESPVAAERGARAYLGLSSFLTNDEVTDIVLLLDGAVRAAVDFGLTELLMDCAEALFNRAQRNIDDAKDSDSIDQSVNHLYWALPPLCGAVKIYRVLGEAVDNERAKIARKRHRVADEDFVRCTNGVMCQVTDLDGERWAYHRRALFTLAAAQGPDAASRYAREELVERHLFYPRALLPRLLAEVV